MTYGVSSHQVRPTLRSIRVGWTRDFQWDVRPTCYCADCLALTSALFTSWENVQVLGSSIGVFLIKISSNKWRILRDYWFAWKDGRHFACSATIRGRARATCRHQFGEEWGEMNNVQHVKRKRVIPQLVTFAYRQNPCRRPRRITLSPLRYFLFFQDAIYLEKYFGRH